MSAAIRRLLESAMLDLEGIWHDHCLYPEFKMPEHQAKRVLALHQRLRKDAALLAVLPDDVDPCGVRVVDPSSLEGARVLREADTVTPTTQGDPPPDSADDLEVHPWKAVPRLADDQLMQLAEAQIDWIGEKLAISRAAGRLALLSVLIGVRDELLAVLPREAHEEEEENDGSKSESVSKIDGH